MQSRAVFVNLTLPDLVASNRGKNIISGSGSCGSASLIEVWAFVMAWVRAGLFVPASFSMASMAATTNFAELMMAFVEEFEYLVAFVVV